MSRIYECTLTNFLIGDFYFAFFLDIYKTDKQTWERFVINGHEPFPLFLIRRNNKMRC